jgi:WS/DGAT/MGAT family acyltransferase
MWEVHLIDGFGTGSAVLFRMHHSIADGITLTRVLLSLTTSDADHAGFTAPPEIRGPLGQVTGLAMGAAGQGLQTIRRPTRLLGAAGATVRGTRRLVHLATIPRKPPSALSGDVGTAKHVTWTDHWPLPDIKRISRAAGVTVNDVLLSVLADALGRYLREQATPLDSVRVMVPVNLRPLDRPLTTDLGNVFGEYVVTLPTGESDPVDRLMRMHAIIEELKGSPEAVVAYLTLVAIGWMPDPVEDLSTRMFSGKVVATVSNVPGPKSQVRLSGTPVSGIIGWVPGAADVGLGVSMFSYDDRVLMGLIADAGLIPDLDRLASHLVSSLQDLAAAIG